MSAKRTTTQTEIIEPNKPTTKREVATVPDRKVAEVMTPNQMLQFAIENKADIAVLEKLMDLRQRWETAEAKKAFTKALTAFKANAPEIMKNKKAGFDSRRTGDTVSYEYATLDAVCAAIAPALSEHGLSHTWETEQSAAGIKVTCILTHKLGHSERVSLMAAPDTSGMKNSIQAIGSTVSYLQRYTLLAATGLAARDMDDDARAATGGGGSKRPTRSDFADEAPRGIPVPKTKKGGPDWTAWRKAILAAMKGAKTSAELEEICTANDALLADCADGDAKEAATINTGIKRRRAQLAPRPFTYLDLDHAKVSLADPDNAAEQFLAVMADAERRSADQLDAFWDANSLSGQLRDAGREDLAEKLIDAYTSATARLVAAKKAAGDGGAAAAPQTAAAAPKTQPQAPAGPTQADLVAASPFRPGVKRNADSWPVWCKLFVDVIGATPVDGIPAILKANERELNYVRAYADEMDGDLLTKIDQALDRKRG
jgi:hypothetical protein